MIKGLNFGRPFVENILVTVVRLSLELVKNYLLEQGWLELEYQARQFSLEVFGVW